MGDTEIKEKQSSLRDLIILIESLRGPHGCPWDRKQTPRSIVVYLIEEIYELVDAIETGDADEICEELGDVLFHVFFLARIFQESGSFSIDDVARNITQKMTRRHPHVFADEKVADTAAQTLAWEAHKAAERNGKTKKAISELDNVPVALPALMRAHKLQKRAARVGFDHISFGLSVGHSKASHASWWYSRPTGRVPAR